MPWNYHYDAREESAERLDDSSQGVLEPTATSASPLRALPNLTKRQRDGRSVPKREQEDPNVSTSCGGRSSENSSTQRRTLATIWPEVRPCSSCPAPTHSQTCIGRPPKFQLSSSGTGWRPRWRRQRSNTRSWPLLGLSQPSAQPNIPAMRRAVQVRRQGQGSKGAEPKKAGPQDKSENRSRNHHDDNLRKQIRTVVKHAVPNNWDREARTQGPKMARQTETGRDLHDVGPAHPRDRARRLPPNPSGWPLFFALISSLSSETEFTNFVSEKIATVRARHTTKRRRIPMPASPRHRARCDCHETRAGIVALLSCCLVRLSNRGWALHSSELPWTRWLPVAVSEGAAKLFFAVLNGTPVSDPEPFKFSCDPDDWAYGQATSESPAKISLHSRQFPCSCCNCTVTRLASQMRGARLLQSKEPRVAVGHDFSPFAVTQQSRACVRRPSLTAVSASTHALSELDLLQEARSAAAHPAEEHLDTLESSGAYET